MQFYRCQRAGGTLDIVSDTAFTRMDAFEQAVLSDTYTGGAPEERTCVALCYDGSALYARFLVEDRVVAAHYTEDNAPLYEEDVVELFLQLPGTEGYFETEFNPNAAVFFAKITFDGKGKHIAFLRGARCKAERTQTGWNVLAEIPFAALGRAPQKGEQWAFNAFRVEAGGRKEPLLYALNPTRCGTFHVPERFIPLRFD